MQTKMKLLGCTANKYTNIPSGNFFYERPSQPWARDLNDEMLSKIQNTLAWDATINIILLIEKYRGQRTDKCTKMPGSVKSCVSISSMTEERDPPRCLCAKGFHFRHLVPRVDSRTGGLALKVSVQPAGRIRCFKMGSPKPTYWQRIHAALA